MENLKLVEIPELIDLLAQQTALYTKMLTSRASDEEFEKCREQIQELQKEIESRREKRGDTF